MQCQFCVYMSVDQNVTEFKVAMLGYVGTSAGNAQQTWDLGLRAQSQIALSLNSIVFEIRFDRHSQF